MCVCVRVCVCVRACVYIVPTSDTAGDLYVRGLISMWSTLVD